jgi:hypothetical protein
MSLISAVAGFRLAASDVRQRGYTCSGGRSWEMCNQIASRSAIASRVSRKEAISVACGTRHAAGAIVEMLPRHRPIHHFRLAKSMLNFGGNIGAIIGQPLFVLM